MQIISGTCDFLLDDNYSVAIGKFDGIHKGHQKLIEDLISTRERGYKTAVFTFDPSPAAFFGNGDYKGLTTRDEKRRIFEKLGIDVLYEYPLNKETASVSPEDFVTNILVRNMNAKYIACGPDLTFGDRGKGDVKLLKTMGAEYGFEVHVSEKVEDDGEEISSSIIRKEVEVGNMEKVTAYIGAPYSVTGVVVKGRQIGRTIGLPTVNLIPECDKLLPPFGVYDAVISYKGGHYKGITNIGVKPTVTNERTITVETYIYDFDEDIYNEWIVVNLIHYKRKEMKFNSLEELKAQIERDIAR